jgi:hypothetical protein
VVVDVDGWRIEKGEVRGWGESMFWWRFVFLIVDNVCNVA